MVGGPKQLSDPSLHLAFSTCVEGRLDTDLWNVIFAGPRILPAAAFEGGGIPLDELPPGVAGSCDVTLMF